jgi:prepilin-type N-terminal cleavage/methylation domain-containing protein
MRTNRPQAPPPPRADRGMTLIELMIALVVLSIGVLAIGMLFPSGSRSQLQSRMTSNANFYLQQKAEELNGLTAADPDLSVGRHPAGTAFDTLGSAQQWRRFYQVDILPAPMNSVRRIAINVSWTYMGARSIADTIYLRR